VGAHFSVRYSLVRRAYTFSREGVEDACCCHFQQRPLIFSAGAGEAACTTAGQRVSDSEGAAEKLVKQAEQS